MLSQPKCQAISTGKYFNNELAYAQVLDTYEYSLQCRHRNITNSRLMDWLDIYMYYHKNLCLFLEFIILGTCWCETKKRVHLTCCIHYLTSSMLLSKVLVFVFSVLLIFYKLWRYIYCFSPFEFLVTDFILIWVIFFFNFLSNTENSWNYRLLHGKHFRKSKL